MTKIKPLISAIEGEAPHCASKIKKTLANHHDVKHLESPDIDDQLTQGAVVKLQAREQQEAGKRVQRAVARGKKAARGVVSDILSAKNAAVAESSKMVNYHADIVQQIAQRNSRAASAWTPDTAGYVTRDNRKDARVAMAAEEMPLAGADEANGPIIAEKVARQPRITRDKPCTQSPPPSVRGR
jgi:hypothetical protein